MSGVYLRHDFSRRSQKGVTMKKLSMAAFALAILAAPALAADMAAKPVYKAPPAPPAPAATGYVEVGTGGAWTSGDETVCDPGGCDGSSNKFTGWVLGGAGRGNFWFSPNGSMQLDAQAESTQYKTPSDFLPPGTSGHFSTLSYLVGGHVNWRNPQSGLLGIFGGAGDAGDGGISNSAQRHFVVGGEGQVYWNQFTLYAQGGYDGTAGTLDPDFDSVHAWFVRGTGRWFADPNLLFELTGLFAHGAIDLSSGFASDIGSSSSVNFNTALIQAKVEWRSTSLPISLFGKYQWSQTRYDTFTFSGGALSEQQKVSDSRVLGGVRLYLGEGTMMANDRHGATLDIIDPLGAPVSPLMFANSPGEEIVSSDIRLKRDIAQIGRLDNGLGLYRYRYLWSDTVYVGVMAQEVALIRPDAVVHGLDGYLRVNYGRLGLHLMTLPEWQAVGEPARL